MAFNFNSIADEFRRTNWRDAGTWGAAPKAVVLLAILVGVPVAGTPPKAVVLLAILVGVPVAGFFAFNQGQIEELEAGRHKEVKLKEEYVNKKRQAVNLDLHRQQLRDIDAQFGALLKQLPNKSQMDALLVDINQAGLGRGLQFELFKPAAAELRRDFYAELPIDVKVTGNYHDMGAFASDVGQLSRIVTLKDVSIATAKDGNLTMDAIARTFRYLDDDEIAAQRKAAHKGAKK